MATFPFLVTAWLGAAGCAAPQVYVPFEQVSNLPAAVRWQALEDVARREGWDVVQSNREAHTLVAYRQYANVSGVRDRIKVELFGNRTIVDTRSEIEDEGRWQAVAARCAKYGFTREKLLAAQLEEPPASPAVPQPGAEMAGRWCRPGKDVSGRTACGTYGKRH